MFKLIIALSALSAVTSAGYIRDNGAGGHGLSYSGAISPSYYHSSYEPAPHYVKIYSAPIVSVPVVKTITPAYKTYKLVETAPVHIVPVVYSLNSYSDHYGIH